MAELQMWQQSLLSIKEVDTRAITAIVEALVETLLYSIEIDVMGRCHAQDIIADVKVKPLKSLGYIPDTHPIHDTYKLIKTPTTIGLIHIDTSVKVLAALSAFDSFTYHLLQRIQGTILDVYA